MSDEKYSDALKQAHEAQRATQAEAIKTQAAMLGGYYRALISEGIPEALAADLVLDLHASQLEKLNPN